MTDARTVELPASITFVVVARNDLKGFAITSKSIVSEAHKTDELLVVDGSDTDEIMQLIEANEYSNSCTVAYHRDNKQGVFPAQNIGLRNASKEWVCVINSGDTLIAGSRQIIEEKIANHPANDLHIFSQIAISEDGLKKYIFTPTASTLWPHQSILIRLAIHDKFGLYDETYKYSAEQLFFATVRHKIRHAIHAEIISTYLLGGFSDKVDIRHCREQYTVRRLIGNNRVLAVFRSWISPCFRVLLRFVVGEHITLALKKIVFRHYK
jgi:glycosyltransferase involved in cell wall biosynthesis